MTEENKWVAGLSKEVADIVEPNFKLWFEELEKKVDAIEQQAPQKLEIKQIIKHNVTNYSTVEGQHHQTKAVIGALAAGSSVMIIGPTGSGKTRVTEHVAKALDCKNYTIRQVNKQTATHDLIGFNNANGNYVPGVFTKVIKEGGLIVIDEVDNGNSNVLMCTKGILSGLIYMPYGMQEVHPDCKIMCTANTWGLGPDREYVGRNALDAALLNEFVCIEWPYDTVAERNWIKQTYARVEKPYITEKQFDKFVDRFQKMRDYAESNKIRVIFSSRNLDQCIRLQAISDWDEFDTLDATVFRSVKGDARRKLMDVYTEKRKPIIKQPKDTSEPKVKETEVPDSVKDIVDEPAPF
jgi:cobaltochelatase CobS